MSASQGSTPHLTSSLASNSEQHHDDVTMRPLHTGAQGSDEMNSSSIASAFAAIDTSMDDNRLFTLFFFSASQPVCLLSSSLISFSANFSSISLTDRDGLPSRNGDRPNQVPSSATSSLVGGAGGDKGFGDSFKAVKEMLHLEEEGFITLEGSLGKGGFGEVFLGKDA